MPNSRPAIVWFRRDLRLADNPALREAAESNRPVVPLYVLDEETKGLRPLGGASRWWLHHSIAGLAADLAQRGAPLTLRRGPAAKVLMEAIDETGADAVYWNRLYEPASVERDRGIKETLAERGITAKSFNASLLDEPWTIKTKSGSPFRVFTPFWNALQETIDAGMPLPPPRKIAGFEKSLASDSLDAWELLPTKPNWAEGFEPEWEPGEGGAQCAFEMFCDETMEAYGTARDVPGIRGTSRLSPHLHFGEIGPRQLWQAVRFRADHHTAFREGASAWLRELGWREFNQHLLFHHPEMPEQNVDDAFDAFRWRNDRKALQAWQQGQTGYPIVDAGMRALWRTGWMHNRVRMIAASFLIKHLLIDWREGEAWFWDTLVDADLANNTGNWQWVAGSGFDAAPYFRIFNPVIQGERFDADGAYVRKWVPEIAALPGRYLHKPWEAPETVLAEAGIRLGETYPLPVVEHKHARQRALDAYAEIKKSRG